MSVYGRIRGSVEEVIGHGNSNRFQILGRTIQMTVSCKTWCRAIKNEASRVKNQDTLRIDASHEQIVHVPVDDEGGSAEEVGQSSQQKVLTLLPICSRPSDLKLQHLLAGVWSSGRTPCDKSWLL
ncbi:hypothetical protein E4U21_006023 [Claviceps maximensis]|nr:hypothetical protein E4U21_006023 [Claviceps maximensis]